MMMMMVVALVPVGEGAMDFVRFQVVMVLALLVWLIYGFVLLDRVCIRIDWRAIVFRPTVYWTLEISDCYQ